jgi:ubiquinol-cytochrome c reductase cytochrome b subunit
MWKKRSLFQIVNNHVIDYPTPINFTYFNGYGFLLVMAFVIQIITGVFLAMHYAPHIDLAFTSVEHIMRDVNNGWLMRYIHANGASFIFIFLYIHMARGLYYSSYTSPRHLLWITGVIIFLLSIVTAFLGYVLPWGQMSFWAATVIINILGAIPVLGDPITELLWGGFAVDNATLNRFFSLHYLLPFVIVGLMGAHLILLHNAGSGNPLGVDARSNTLAFYPYFVVKDFFGFFVYLMIFFIFVCFMPNYLGHTDNYIPANALVTPAHIVPEWYLLPFYAILRSIPDKLLGVIAMGVSIIVLAVLPFIVPTKNIRSSMFKPLTRKLFWVFCANFVVLVWIGGQVAEEPYITIGQIATGFYMLYFFMLLPLVTKLEVYLLSIGNEV